MPEALLSVEAARERILAGLSALGAETVALGGACGRTLAAPVFAQRSSPPVAVSAMDGYAVAHRDIAHAPIELPVSQTIAAGTPAQPLTPGTAARVFTGAQIPAGADCVLLQEDAEAREGRVLFRKAIFNPAYLRREGLDFTAGALGLAQGRTLTPRDIGLAAAMNVSALSVRRRPRVAILATGNELVPPGADPLAHQIIASSGPALTDALRLWGADAVDLGLVRDDEREIAAHATRARDCDLLLTLGGASVGDHDLVHRALSSLGFDLGFWKIAMRPGKPLLFGRLGSLPVLGLPGNPVSTLVCALIFVRPMIRMWLGCQHPDGSPDIELPVCQAILTAGLPENGPRADYLRGKMVPGRSGLPRAEALPFQDSSQLSALAQADCLIPRTPFAPASKAETSHTVVPLEGLF